LYWTHTEQLDQHQYALQTAETGLSEQGKQGLIDLWNDWQLSLQLTIACRTQPVMIYHQY